MEYLITVTLINNEDNQVNYRRRIKREKYYKQKKWGNRETPEASFFVDKKDSNIRPNSTGEENIKPEKMRR